MTCNKKVLTLQVSIMTIFRIVLQMYGYLKERRGGESQKEKNPSRSSQRSLRKTKPSDLALIQNLLNKALQINPPLALLILIMLILFHHSLLLKIHKHLPLHPFLKLQNPRKSKHLFPLTLLPKFQLPSSPNPF